MGSRWGSLWALDEGGGGGASCMNGDGDEYASSLQS